MSEVQVFTHDTFGAHTVRLDDNGNAVFVLKPVAEALGYRDAANAVRVLDRDEHWTEVINLPTPVVSTSQVRRRMTVVSESGEVALGLCVFDAVECGSEIVDLPTHGMRNSRSTATH